MSNLFISHSSKDDAFVRELRWTLADLKQEVWIDSRELRAGDALWPEIQKAIEESSAVAVVVSPDALQARWVGKELRHALDVQKQRGRGKFPVFALSLNGTKLGVLEELFGGEPVYIPVSSAAGGVEAAMNSILVATGKRLPAEVPVPAQPEADPLEELVLELADLKLHEEAGVRRPSARAKLVYQPATPGQREVESARSWRLVAPLGPIEMDDLRWYLQDFAVWPSGVPVIQDRARKVEENLAKWGKLLHEAAMPVAHTANVKNAWSRIDGHAGRRFSVHVNAMLEVGAAESDESVSKQVATLLLALPWELLHDEDGYLFQGAKPTRVRRRLPNARTLDVSVVAAPIRILLVTARPVDDSCGYIDHRASALPLVEAMEELGGLVRLHVLSPPTFDALSVELKRAFDAREPYHVVHFDGHGVYDPNVGLGGLCFEDPQDIDELQKRRHVTVFTTKLGPLLRDHRIPLVFLEACQTAQSEKASESVASELLKVGVASVVAMSHSVLVETARRFVEVFYGALARGVRVGDAMLEGQRALKDNTSRGRTFGGRELRLEDWFVPVLFQEKDDPQLFRNTPAPQTQEDLKTILASRLGELPAVPATGFVGRSRELLALQRLLRQERYAVVRGQGGEGKTALAAEFARWMVRSHQIRRAAFVSVETHGNERAVIDALGRQIVQKEFSAAGDLADAIQQVERALREQSTLLVVDNMESILLPPYLETPEALSEEAGRELQAILAVCERLLQAGDTRIVFTSREALPAPFDADFHRRELHRLDREDAVKLVERVLNADDGAGASATLDAARESIEALVDAVHGHARTLALLAPSLRGQGVDATREALVELMAAMEKQFPGSREHSLFASVELSLRRMSPANRDRARALGMFHGGFKLEVLETMMQLEEVDVLSLAGELIGTGLASTDRYNHLTLNPALCPYLRGQMGAGEREALMARWVETMRWYAEWLVRQRSQNTEIAATLTVLELPNFFALLDHGQRAGNPEVAIELATSLHTLLQSLGKPRLIECVGRVRDGAAAGLGGRWNHLLFEAQESQIEQQLDDGRLREAFDGAQLLLARARAAGKNAYVEADYDLAKATTLMGQVLETAHMSEQALFLFDEARARFEAITTNRGKKAAEGMAAICYGRRGDCLRSLGRLDKAAASYEERIRRGEILGDERGVAVGKGQLGTVRMQQRREKDALEAFQEALDRFTRLDEPRSVAAAWHQIGMVYEQAEHPAAAENAYRKSLAITVRLGDLAGQARTLNQLGILYDDLLSRTEEAAAFLSQAADKFFEIHDLANEGMVRNNLAFRMRKLRLPTEARKEIRRAIECKEAFGHAASIWSTWAILAEIETETGNPIAAAEAKRKAIDSFLDYRRDGGENQHSDGRICLAVTQHIIAGDPAAAALLLEELAANPEAARLLTFIQALQAIVAGRRERTLADAPDLDYTMAAEILFLLETLEKAGK